MELRLEKSGESTKSYASLRLGVECGGFACAPMAYLSIPHFKEALLHGVSPISLYPPRLYLGLSSCLGDLPYLGSLGIVVPSSLYSRAALGTKQSLSTSFFFPFHSVLFCLFFSLSSILLLVLSVTSHGRRPRHGQPRGRPIRSDPQDRNGRQRRAPPRCLREALSQPETPPPTRC